MMSGVKKIKRPLKEKQIPAKGSLAVSDRTSIQIIGVTLWARNVS